MGSQEFNDLHMPQLSKQQLCDRTRADPAAEWGRDGEWVKGSAAHRVKPLHSVGRKQERLPYRHGGCCVALKDTAAFFHVVLGLQLRMPERPGRLRQGTRRRRSTRDVASWLASLIERKAKCRRGDRVASFRETWLRKSPRDVDGASRPFSELEKAHL